MSETVHRGEHQDPLQYLTKSRQRRPTICGNVRYGDVCIQSQVDRYALRPTSEPTSEEEAGRTSVSMESNRVRTWSFHFWRRSASAVDRVVYEHCAQLDQPACPADHRRPWVQSVIAHKKQTMTFIVQIG